MALPHGRWKTTTLVAGLASKEIAAPMVLDRVIIGCPFQAYIETFLVPALTPGDVVVIHNLASPRRIRRGFVTAAASHRPA